MRWRNWGCGIDRWSVGSAVSAFTGKIALEGTAQLDFQTANVNQNETTRTAIGAPTYAAIGSKPINDCNAALPSHTNRSEPTAK